MAKATEKDKKAPPAEELVEKPREAMFSRTGLILMIGTNILIAVVVLMVAKLFLATPADPPIDGGAASSGMMQSDQIDYFILKGCSALVPTGGSGPAKKVRFKVIMQFSGTSEERVTHTTTFTTGGREDKLRQLATSVTQKYTYDKVQDASFVDTFEKDFMDRFNGMYSNVKLLEAKIAEIE